MTLEELYRVLRSSHVQSQGVLDTLSQPLLVLDRGFSVVTANPTFYRAFHTDREATVGKSIFDLGDGQWNNAGLRALLQDVVPKSVPVVGHRIEHNFPEVGQRTMLVTARQLVHPDDNSTQMLVVFEDITEREKSEAAKDMILAETKHRMKNLIGTVRAMIRQTPLESHTIEEYRDIVLGRLEAILIAQETISGGPETALAALVQKSLHAIGLDRIVFAESPKINISQHQVQPLSLIFHELATNAVKYGTLSRAEGHIHLGWRKEQQGDGQLLVLDWREDGGPAVTEPKRHGFGTDLIDFSLKGEGGEIIRHFEPSGLRLQLRLPLHRE